MPVTIWFFLRPRVEELLPVALAKMEEFFKGRGRLPVDEEGLVRYAEVLVLLENRRAVEVLRVGCFQSKVGADGLLDRDHQMELMATACDVSCGHLPFPKPPAGLVHAEHRFAKRRYENIGQWKPTRTESTLLRKLVNHKAGREIM